MAGNDIKLTLWDWVKAYTGFLTPFLSAVLIIILIYASFKIGVMYSCAGGILNGNHCITPKIIKTIQVCETKIDNCREVCKLYEVKDDSRYQATFNISVPE